MGNPAYDARRAAEQAEHEERKAAAEATTVLMDTIRAIMAGSKAIHIDPNPTGGWSIKIGH